jgi:ABC-type multidrug transport system fused ATPase/permease subunit
MRKNKINIPYERGEGVRDLHLLDDLNTSQNNIEKTKRVFINNLNNEMPSLKINKWICLTLPFGLLIIILAAILLEMPYTILVIIIGIFIICLLPIYFCFKWRMLETVIKTTSLKINQNTNNELTCTPKYKKKVKRDSTSTRSYKFLNYFCVEVNEYEFAKRRKKSEKEELKNLNQVDESEKVNGGIKMENNVEVEPMRDYFETNLENGADQQDLPKRKNTDAFEIHDIGINKKKEFVEEKEPELKVDMIKMENK